MKNEKSFLVTGSAGFIGFHLCKLLLESGVNVVGIDNLNEYYDVKLKLDRNSILSSFPNYKFIKHDLSLGLSNAQIESLDGTSAIIHLAAQAGVRNSIDAPEEYLRSNIQGSFNVLELAKKISVEHVLLASTSSVYGSNDKLPFSELDNCSTPMSFYAASKLSMESMAHSYSHVFDIPVTIFRFFTVYGPWGRPDMALFKFTKNILAGETIEVYNNGDMKRDFTYVEDLARCVHQLIDNQPVSSADMLTVENSSPVAPFRIVNIGNSNTVELLDFVKVIEKLLQRKAKISFKGMQIGDVKETLASNDRLCKLIETTPYTNIEVGVQNFIDWYLQYYSR